jgi:metallo-beta-lactamase class B
MPFKYLPMQELCPSGDVMEISRVEPWKLYVPAFKMAPGVYNVGGNTWMSSYLIDTGAGLVLIDTELQECLYLILENIRSLGYDPKDITDIFVTHAHIDHIGAVAALKALTGAKVWLGKRDLHFLNNPNLVGAALGYKCSYVPFEPDSFYDDNIPIKIGNITFETMNTAGHTPGTTSFFFDVIDKNGKKLRCGLHGGIGNNTFSDEYFEKTGEDPALREEFADGLKKLINAHVDICLPSHNNQTGPHLFIDQITEEYNPYDDPSIWKALMEFALDRFEKAMGKKY